MSSVPYSGKKYASTWQIKFMTMNDGMKQAGIHKYKLLSTFLNFLKKIFNKESFFVLGFFLNFFFPVMT